MKWQTLPIDRYREHAAEWDALARDCGAIPFHESAFIEPLLTEFGSGDTLATTMSRWSKPRRHQPMKVDIGNQSIERPTLQPDAQCRLYDVSADQQQRMQALQSQLKRLRQPPQPAPATLPAAET